MKICLLVLAIFAFSARYAFSETSLTIYNDNFAIVRETMTLNLKTGVNEVRRGQIADYAEPSSVILRDLSGKNTFSVLQQSFHGAALTQDGMLNAFAGQMIDFRQQENGKSEIVQGRIIRGGRAIPGAENRFIAPIIEVAGKRQFELPGTPLFPTKINGVEIEPEFTWKISAPKAGEVPAEIAYATYAINWFADYNVIATEDQDTLQITGWITLENKTGLNFENARAKFVAGSVGKLSPRPGATIPYKEAYGEAERIIVTGSNIPTGPPAKEVEAYYSYNSPIPISVRNGENMQLEFLRAENIPSQRVYLYAGANDQSGSYYVGGANLDPDKGTDSFTTISLVREFKNSVANHLGSPLPQGRMRFYRRAADQQLEFVGEMDIPATPKDERVQVVLGNTFDLIAERIRTEFKVDPEEHSARESFQIKLRNHKSEQVEIRVREKLFRWSNWEITAKSDPFVQKDATTIEFNVPVKAGEEKVVSYTVVYTKLPRGEPGR